MDGSNTHNTFGENFLLSLQKAESKGLLFAALEDAVARYYPQYNLLVQLSKISNFDSVAQYHDKLARVRIEYNAKIVNELRQRLIGLNNIGGNDNYRYKEKMVRKLNLLINNHPTLEDVIYIAATAYCGRGYGSVERFKTELAEHYRENKGDACGAVMAEIVCEADECRV